MDVLKIDPSDEGIEKFYGAQKALTLPKDHPLYTQFKLNRGIDVEYLRTSEDGTEVLFREGRVSMDLLNSRVLRAK